MKTGRLRRLVVNTTLLAGSTLIALVMLEWCVRTFDLGPRIYPASYHTFRLSENPVLGYELAPGAPDGRHAINRFGMRDRDYALSKPPDVFRIAIVGDSIAYGWLLDRDESFVSVMQRKLDRAAPNRYQVLNFGVTGYNATQIAEAVRRKVVLFDPDLLLYAYCLNDPQGYSTEMARLLAQVPGVARALWSETSIAWLRRSRVALLAMHGYRTMFRPDTHAPEHVPLANDPQFAALNTGNFVNYFRTLHTEQGGWSRVRRAVQTMVDVTPAPVVVAVFPLLEKLQDYPLEAVHQKIERGLSAEGVAVLDLYGAFRRAERRSGSSRLDALHPNRDGHALAARKILAYLDREFLPGNP